MSAPRRIPRSLLLLPILLALWFVGQERGPVVVVYTSLDPVFSRTVLGEFERETGIRVRAVFDTEATKTTGLIERLRRERARPTCDVLWSNEPLRTIRLAHAGHFAPYVSASALGIPLEFRDPAGLWTGFAARARVVAFDPQRLPAEQVPKTLDGLLDPQFRGEVAVADPRFGTTGSHFGALLAQWGEGRYRTFLESLVANDVQVVAGNSTSRDRVLSGEALLGLTDTDDVEVARRAGDSIAEGFFSSDGTLVLPNTVSLIAGAPHPEAGRALIDFLLDPAREELLAASPSRQIPLRPSVIVPPGGLRLDDVARQAVSLEDAAEALPRALEIAREVFGL